MAGSGNAAAILLCAGKGTRMGRNDRNKVCCDCAGIPVVRRIVANMRRGGIGRFVVVVGHMAESVMSALDGESGIIYAYQKEQKGTGHAAMCGLRSLEDIGFSGPVVISMGDKIVSVEAVKNILDGAGNRKALCTCGVQSRLDHPNGGHVILEDGKALGIIEYADIQAALKSGRRLSLCGRSFDASEVAATPWVNTALYRFDSASLSEALAACGSDNAQGEIYLTDTIEYFAKRGEVSVYRIENKEDLLTYSTKTELREVSRHFLRNASELKEEYPRFSALIERFIERFGDRKAVVARAPGRVNLMGRHIEHRGGGVNVMATESGTVMVAAPREDDVVRLVNASGGYPEREFRIGAVAPGTIGTKAWLKWLAGDFAKSDLAANRGDWSNYVKGIAYRMQAELDFPLCGMDVMVDGDIPVAAGLSSSSALVVAAAEALSALNCLDMEDGAFVALCGEGEWYVGSRGGAGDHAAMRCSRPGMITHLGFKPFEIGRAVKFPANCSVIVANSLEESKKSEGSRDIFNARVAAYEFALMLVKREFPDLKLVEFRDLAFCAPADEVRNMIAAIPAKVTRGELKKLLPEIRERLEEIFATHADPGEYDLHGVAAYGVSEIMRAEIAPRLLSEGRFEEFGELMKISHDGDRVSGAKSTAGVAPGAGLERDCGAYACSTARIDEMCDLMNSTDGVYGSSIAGAGLGGCVLVLVDRSKAASVMDRLNREFYDRLSLPRSAFVCNPSGGSRVVF
jgi:N-acetylgalactosamine kinase